MKPHKIKINNKIVGVVFIFTDQFEDLEDKYKIIEDFSEKIPKIKEIGYAGYDSRISLKFFIDWIIYGNDPLNLKYKKIESQTLLKIIKELLVKCSEIIREDKIYLFIFPTLSKFVIEKMGGSSGFCTNKNTIVIGTSKAEDWEHNFKGTLIHELAHALAGEYFSLDKMTVGERIIFDGIAENFRDSIVGGKSPPWTNFINKKQAKTILNKIKSKLGSSDSNFHNDLFHGTGKYPLWAGYTIGYYLVKDYLKKIKKVNWRKIIKTKPQKILNEVLNYEEWK